MAKLNAEVLEAVVDGKRKGETVELDERSAENLAALGYVRIKPKESKQSEKGKSAPKKGSTKSKAKQPSKEEQ